MKAPHLKSRTRLVAQSALAAISLFFAFPATAAAEEGMVDLSRAIIVVPASFGRVEQQAVTMLIEEVAKRTQLHWHRAPAGEPVPVIIIASSSTLNEPGGKALADLLLQPPTGRPEGYQLCVRSEAARPTVTVFGNDARGVMFGVGRLLRELHLTRGKAELSSNLRVSTAPICRLRGHQLGYRPKTNSYDAWDVANWEQYLRDLIIFGCNAIELIPPRSDDAADSPHFPRPPLEMMTEMSRLADQYGLDVWIWYPAMDKDYSDPRTVATALAEWGKVFQALPRIDAVFVPGGDPGHTAPQYLMDVLEQETRELHKTHPTAQMWVSPQSFDQTWLDEFLTILRRDQPTWLSGIVYGPQVRVSLPKLREAVPSHYPIRHYPDITHSRQCQYPVRDWDVAFALTEARECINPRPEDEAIIFRATYADTIGFITYSEGCNDDVNKAVWSALGWDPQVNIQDILRQFSRYFIGDPMADGFAQGLLALERNWRGPLLANAAVETVLRQFQALERAATPQQLHNWRFQQALFRAYYDAYTRHRLIYETGLEEEALDRLAQATNRGALIVIAEADAFLNRATTDRVATDLRERVLELGEALFQSIGMQLSVDKYKAIAVDRGAALDTLDYPLNNRFWLKEQFARIRRLTTEPDRLHALQRIVDWENPGPGGFYDDLGNPARQPHLWRGVAFEQDPGGFVSARNGYEEDLAPDEDEPPPQGVRRFSWLDHAETLYDEPLQVRYTGLDPRARYKVRVVYAGDTNRRKIRLVANEGLEVHPYLPRPVPFAPLEFDLPPSATASGTLTLSWSGEPGLGGNGRGCQVSELWLMKKAP